MDPYIDPLDLEPRINVDSLRTRMKTQSSSPQKANESFESVMKQTVKQEPTPVWVPKPIGAEPNVNQSGIIKFFGKPEPNPVEEPASNVPIVAANETKAVVPQPIEHNRPRSLREMLQPIEPDTSGSKPQNAVETNAVDSKQEQETPVNNNPNETNPVKTNSSPGYSERSVNYVIQRGDTLSGIVANRMKELGIDYSVGDLYGMVRTVAEHNNIPNADRIFAGNRVDLSPVHDQTLMVAAVRNSSMQSMAAGANVANITSPFGYRNHPLTNEIRHHNGVDIRAAEGTPVLPAKSGVVTFSGKAAGYGNMIEIDHGDGTQTRYAHLSERLVSNGEYVTRNNPVALSGSTGNVTGPHLHFEYHQNGEPVDPQEHIDSQMLLAPPA